MHVVHFDSVYSTFDEAVNATDGVHVLAFLFEVCRKLRYVVNLIVTTTSTGRGGTVNIKLVLYNAWAVVQ